MKLNITICGYFQDLSICHTSKYAYENKLSNMVTNLFDDRSNSNY